jgi:hypothetical protein
MLCTKVMVFRKIVYCHGKGSSADASGTQAPHASSLDVHLALRRLPGLGHTWAGRLFRELMLELSV